MNRPLLARVAISTSALALGVVAGCAAAPSHSGSSEMTQPEALHDTMAQLAARHAAADGVYVERTLADVLPNQAFSVENRPAERVANAVVVGTIEEVRPGAGYAVSGDDADRGNIVDFDSPDALWKVVVLEIAVDKDLGDDVATSTIKVGLSIDGPIDVDTVARGLIGERVLAPLAEPGSFSFDRALPSILHSGALLGLISDSGRLSMPGLGEDEAEFLDGTDTMAEVSAEATKNKPVVDVGSVRGGFSQAD